MNKLQILLITLLCFELNACGLNNNSLSRQTLISIKEQTERNWYPPVKASNIEDVRVILYIALNENGSLNEVKIKDVICPPHSDETCKLTAESCIKAVKKTVPYKLPLTEYETWKEFNMMFDPSAIAKAEISKPSKNVYVEIPKN